MTSFQDGWERYPLIRHPYFCPITGKILDRSSQADMPIQEKSDLDRQFACETLARF